MSVSDGSNRQFAQRGVCAGESKKHEILPLRAYFQSTPQMVFETLQVKNDTQLGGSAYPLGDLVLEQSVPAEV